MSDVDFIAKSIDGNNQLYGPRQANLVLIAYVIANAVINQKSYFRPNIGCDIINVKREQQGTKNSALGDTSQNWGPV